MYPGSDPRHLLEGVLREQREVRERVWREAEVRRRAPSFRRWSPAAFKVWRLHMMVWVEDGRGS